MSAALPVMEAARGTLQELGGLVERAPAEIQPPGAAAHLLRLAQEIEAQVTSAGRPFTVAVVGEFKVGKSTLLNGLLGLSGGAALSAEDSPDTARSILLRARQTGDPEARLHFAGDRSAQDASWAAARDLTSQVRLDQDRLAAGRASDLLEVEYFVAAPLLERFQFNDLPGTGAHSHLRHTEIAHQRMKLADAVLWVVAGDREPGADARADLDVLAQYAQKVLPVVNVIEDPAADPPIERQQELAVSIAQTVEREFRSHFSPLVEGPVLVSARALAVERAKAEADPAALAATGYDQLVETLELLLDSQERNARQCLAATAALDQAASVLTECEEAAERHRDALRAAAEVIEGRLEEVSNTQLVLRRQVATLVQAKAAEICQRIAGQADQFIAAQLNASNFKAMFSALTQEGRARLKAELQEDFEVHYLRLRDHPNWLDATTRRLVDDVRALVIAEWRRISRAQLVSLDGDGDVTLQPIDMERIGADLQNTMVAVLTGGAVTGGGLVAVLGHTIFLVPVAALFVGLAMLVVAVGKPFKRRQETARERVRNEIEMHRHVVAERLEEAIWQSIGQIEQRLRQDLEGSSGESQRDLAQASALVAALRRGHDRLLSLRDTLERLANGEEAGDEAAHA